MTKQRKELTGRRILIVDPDRTHARLHGAVCDVLGGANEIAYRVKIDDDTLKVISERRIDTVVFGSPTDEADYIEHGGKELDRLLDEGILRRVVVVSMKADMPDSWDIPEFRNKRANKADVIYFKRNEELVKAIAAR